MNRTRTDNLRPNNGVWNQGGGNSVTTQAKSGAKQWRQQRLARGKTVAKGARGKNPHTIATENGAQGTLEQYSGDGGREKTTWKVEQQRRQRIRG